MVNPLEQEFTRAKFEIYRCAKEEANYSATIFLGMIHDRGRWAAAKALINAAKPSDGYTALSLKNRLDLTVEAEVVENAKWHVLFTDEEITRAKRRLERYGYKPKAR